jgi:hypothetical protein
MSIGAKPTLMDLQLVSKSIAFDIGWRESNIGPNPVLVFNQPLRLNRRGYNGFGGCIVHFPFCFYAFTTSK